MNDRTFLIGICDDEQADLERIEEALLKSMEKSSMKGSVDCRLFQDGEALFESCQREAYDLLFLDIEMPGVDGFELAKRICMGARKCSIIFVSGYESLVFDSWQYSPLWFVRKGMLERDMRLALKKCLEREPFAANCCLFKGKEMPLGDIMYIECKGHLLFVKRKDGRSFEQYGSLKAFEEEFSASSFLRIHKSYLVNQRYIKEIGKREVLLTDGTLLEMGRDRRKSLLEAMARYEKEQQGGLP